MGEYTLLTLISIVVVVGLELFVFRTGLFRMAAYWLSMLIVLGFQVPVDGWLTKLSAPIVLYNEDQMLGIRAPWDIPIEDFGFGFSMITLTMLLWLRAKRAYAKRPGGAPSEAGMAREHSEAPTGQGRPAEDER